MGYQLLFTLTHTKASISASSGVKLRLTSYSFESRLLKPLSFKALTNSWSHELLGLKEPLNGGPRHEFLRLIGTLHRPDHLVGAHDRQGHGAMLAVHRLALARRVLAELQGAVPQLEGRTLLKDSVSYYNVLYHCDYLVMLYYITSYVILYRIMLYHTISRYTTLGHILYHITIWGCAMIGVWIEPR